MKKFKTVSKLLAAKKNKRDVTYSWNFSIQNSGTFEEHFNNYF